MDRSKLRAICESHVRPMADFLGLSDWKVYWKFERDADDAICARCKVDVDYRQAVISIDMDHLDDDDQVVDILFHELCHVVLWPFDLYREMVGQVIPEITDGRPNGMVENRAWNHACEGGVLMLEKLWRSHLRDIYLGQFTAPAGRP